MVLGLFLSEPILKLSMGKNGGVVSRNLPLSNAEQPSGPFLVSRTGDAG